jgi:hypothetical protein
MADFSLLERRRFIVVFSLFLVLLFYQSRCYCQETHGKGKKYTSFHFFQGAGWTTSDDFVAIRNPTSISGLFFERCGVAQDIMRSGFSAYYMRVPYQLSYFSAGVIAGENYIWRSNEEITTHSIQFGIPFHYLIQHKNRKRSSFKICSMGGLNFLEREKEIRNFELKKNTLSGLWEATDRPSQELRMNQSQDTEQWHLSTIISYGLESDTNSNIGLSFNVYYLVLTGGRPTGPFLSFRSANSFPTNSAGDPRLQVLRNLTHVVGFSVGVGFSSFSAEGKFD